MYAHHYPPTPFVYAGDERDPTLLTGILERLSRCILGFVRFRLGWRSVVSFVCGFRGAVKLAQGTHVF